MSHSAPKTFSPAFKTSASASPRAPISKTTKTPALSKSAQDTSIRYAFWTSGWDSTFMIIRLMRAGFTVQPIYVDNPRRKSREYELAALKELSHLISERIPEGRLLPLRVVPLQDITIDEDIAQSFQSLLDRLPAGQRPLGYQYRYLASYIKQNRSETPYIAIGIERASRPEECACSAVIQQFGQLDRDHRVDPEHSDPDLVTLLGGFEFPIMDISETEMRENIKTWGYEDIMQHIWFCHRPIKGRPCGFCNPCSGKIASGMSFLLPSEALERHAHFARIEQKYGRKVKKLCDTVYHFFHR